MHIDPSGDISASVASIFTKLKIENFNTHLLTSVAAGFFSADCIQSFDITPSLTSNTEEIEDFVNSAKGLLVNLGMLDMPRQKSSLKAVNFANNQNKKWVLDPVKIHRSHLRKEFCKKLMKLSPAILKLNGEEYQSLFLNDNILSKALEHNLIIVKTGVIDVISNGQKVVKISNGHEFMHLGIAYGCATGAVMAACVAVHPNPFEAAVAAVAIMGIAGELAAKKTTGPASFRNIFVDELYNLSEDKIIQTLNISQN